MIEFLRPEDGAWDTQDPNRFYFVTTDRFNTVKTGSISMRPPAAGVHTSWKTRRQRRVLPSWVPRARAPPRSPARLFDRLQIA